MSLRIALERCDRTPPPPTRLSLAILLDIALHIGNTMNRNELLALELKLDTKSPVSKD